MMMVMMMIKHPTSNDDATMFQDDQTSNTCSESFVGLQRLGGAQDCQSMPAVACCLGILAARRAGQDQSKEDFNGGS